MHNTKKVLLVILSFFILFNTINADEVKDDKKTITNLTIQKGDTIKVQNIEGDWIVKDVTEDKTCNIDEPSEPEVNHVDENYEGTFAYTYENTCLKIATKTLLTCSEFDCKAAAAGQSAMLDNSPVKIFSNINKKYDLIIDYFDKPEYNIVKIKSEYMETVPSGSGIQPGSTGGTYKINCYNFIDTYETVIPRWHYTTYDCTNWGTCYDPYTKGTYDCCKSHACVGHTLEGTPISRPNNDCYKSSCASLMGKYSGQKPASSSNCSAAYEMVPICSGPVYKYSTTTSVTYCAEAGPTKVEAYTFKFTLHTTTGDKEAYCVNPAYDYNSSYIWDTTFDASKCVDSLHSNENGTLKYNMECGYVYILAEAKRINTELGKEVFSYSTISTAMRLFGTGITTKNSTLPEIADIAGHLQSAGYYTTYHGWGYGEDVSIPTIVPPKPTNWPTIYRNWMPKLYNIYIHTANVAESYLKEGIRYSDVGNVECDGSNSKMCVAMANGKNYIVDADYYLNYKECSINYETCTSRPIDDNPSEGDQGRIALFPETSRVYKDDDAEEGSIDKDKTPAPNNAILQFIVNNNGQEVVCTNESGLGVLCGKEKEKITGTSIGSNGWPNGPEGTLPDSNYLDAIYLYIRALQGNKILYEKKIQEAIDKYKPVEGLTKVIYNTNGDEAGYALRYTIDTQSTYENSEVDCKAGDPECEASIFIYDANNNLIQRNDSYDYCIKNYCYVDIKYTQVCTNEKSTNTLKSVVVSDPDLKHTFIKKIGNGGKQQQILYVYDDTGSITGGFCEDIIAVQDKVTVNCPCNPKEKSNTVIPDGNIHDVNYCSDNYNAFDELYYGDPSMSTILNACYEEDRVKYDFTEDLNANGNDLVHEGEQPVSKYSYQIKSDDFDVCTLYCRDESRLYLANKISVRSGMNLQYDIGGKLLDKKLINETVNQRDKNSYKYMPSVVLQYRECTSMFDSEKWEKLYNKASNEREKNQLIYSAYNCNLYTTAEIVDAINKKEIPDILGLNNKEYINKTGSIFKDKNSLNNNYAEPAMIEYAYSIDTGKVTIVKDWGTTKDYLLKQEACTSMGKERGTDCANYDITDYSDTYYKSLGILMGFEHGLVKSNLNDTIYCSGNKCYKLLGKDGKYYYNTKDSVGKYDYTTVDATYDDKGNLVHTESGKILSYNDWAINSKEYDKNSKEFKSKKVGGYKIPTNDYSSFIVVTETGFYNDKSYYVNSYTGEIGTESTEKNTILEPNIFPLHLNKDTDTYPITSVFTKVRTAYKRSNYYKEKNYSLNEDIKYNTNALPSSFQYVCYYDVYSIKPGDTEKNDGAIGFTYRTVDLEDVFASVTDGESSSDRTREYPENWSTGLGQSTLNEVENSAAKILEPEGDGDTEYSYLEYSYTLTKQGILKLRKYNDSQKSNGGYLNDTVVNCEYDPVEKIFYNCDSSFLEDLSKNTGEYSGEGLITVNKDNGASEFCSSMHNYDKDYCKYQKKSILTAGGNN